MAIERTTGTLQSGTMGGESQMANIPGAYMEIMKDVARVPRPFGVTWVHLDDSRTAPGPLADAEQIAHGACLAVGAKLRRVEYRDGALRVFVDGTEEQARRVGGIVSASLSAWDEVAVNPDPPVRQRGTVGDLEAVLYLETALRWLDALPMPEPKPTTCDECGAVAELVPLIGCCYYCTHRVGGRARDVEKGAGLAAVEPKEEPGPHEGACAWASSCWEEL